MSSSRIFHLLPSSTACPHSATPATHKAGQVSDIFASLYRSVYICVRLHLCLCFEPVLWLWQWACAGLCACMCMHAAQATGCDGHKTENINMLSLQQGASHQGNNSARHTLSQPKHIVWNAPAKQHCSRKHKIKGRHHTHRAWSCLIKLRHLCL